MAFQPESFIAFAKSSYLLFPLPPGGVGQDEGERGKIF
jgi:hypothetical protein